MKLKPGPERVKELAKVLHQRSFAEKSKAMHTPPENPAVVDAEWTGREAIRAFWTGIAEEALKWIT